MDVLSYIIASRLLSCSNGNGANIKLDENGNIITDEDITLYVDFPTASLITDGDMFSVTDSYLIAKIIGNVAESNKKAWIYSML
jgi:hypothetical protein